MAKQQKKTWEMNYGEIFQAWSDKFAFGAKGELTPHEAQQIHKKWKRLGILAKQGTL
jgi:hypothetical protein